MEEAFKQASKLPDADQSSPAAAIWDEMEAKWQRSLSDSQDHLGKLADEAHEELESARIQPLGVKKN